MDLEVGRIQDLVLIVHPVLIQRLQALLETYLLRSAHGVASSVVSVEVCQALFDIVDVD